MGYKIGFLKPAEKEFKRFDSSVRKQITAYLERLAGLEDPRTAGDPLKSNLSGLWRYRVGNYRIVAEIQEDALVILVVTVSHRRDVYKKTAERMQ